MGFLDRLRGIPDEVARPVVTEASSAPAIHAPMAPIPRGFDMRGLPMPDAQVRAEVEGKSLIVAIKAYRQQTGVGLAEAKAVIDAVARGDRLVGSGTVWAEAVVAPAPVASPREGVGAEIDTLIRAGQKIQAIKVHREAYGIGLKESKEAIEARWDQLARG